MKREKSNCGASIELWGGIVSVGFLNNFCFLIWCVIFVFVSDSELLIEGISWWFCVFCFNKVGAISRDGRKFDLKGWMAVSCRDFLRIKI